MKTRDIFWKIPAMIVFMLFFMIPGIRTHAEVLDYANLFTQSEAAEIEELAKDVKEHIRMDVVILTTEDAQGYETKYFADEVYNGMMGKEYGTGSDHSGFIYTIDMDNREVFIQGYGKAILYLTDSAAENIIDVIFPYITNGQYGASAIHALNEVRDLYDRGIQKNQYTYDSETGEIVRYKSVQPIEGIVSAVVAFVVSFFFFNGVRSSHKHNAKMSRNAGLNVGFAKGAMNPLESEQDQLINQRTYTRTIPTSTHRSGGGGSSGRSTTYRGSSGRSFSGSGRKF